MKLKNARSILTRLKDQDVIKPNQHISQMIHNPFKSTMQDRTSQGKSMHKSNNVIHSFILDYHLIRKISLKMIQSA